MAGALPLRATSSRPEPKAKEAINAAAGGERDAVFPRSVRKSYKAVSSATRETPMLRIPWGPRLSVLFDTRGATNIGGGYVKVYAVIEADEFLVSRTLIPSAAGSPVPVINVEAACDSFVVTALLGTPLPPGTAQTVECFVYASTYAGSL